jgi:cytochrome P450
VIPDANQLDLTRPQGAHLAFGAGVHHCLGAQLARMELQEALGGLLRRLPSLRPDAPVDELTFKQGMFLRSLRELPVRW